MFEELLAKNVCVEADMLLRFTGTSGSQNRTRPLIHCIHPLKQVDEQVPKLH